MVCDQNRLVRRGCMWKNITKLDLVEHDKRFASDTLRINFAITASHSKRLLEFLYHIESLNNEITSAKETTGEMLYVMLPLRYLNFHIESVILPGILHFNSHSRR